MWWVLFSIAFWTWLALTSLVFFCVALVIFVVTLPFDPNGRVLHRFTCFWGTFYLVTNPLWRVRVVDRGGMAEARRRPFVIVSNHQSFGDILVLVKTFLPFKFVSKRSVFRVPLIGWNCTLNRYVPIVRGDRESAERMVETCVAWIRRGVSVLLFPEGTRSRDGEIGPFKLGAFRVAREAGCPVLPVVVEGTRDVLPSGGVVLRSRVDAVVHVLPPVEAGGHATLEEAADAVRARMAEELARIRAARRAA